ncbi:lactoylglutathione lyase [Kiloniella sp.]|uniref:lactoylglutathione lyase n=1 Tax=Kiloniella sp. TaxID=1938587 RepID=UPI003B01AF12
MGKTDTPAVVPSRILYTMVRVTNLERSIAFYRDALGMRELRRETFSDARFTLVFIGYGDEASNAVLELTYNWDTDTYEHGNGYGHVALEVEDIYAACTRLEKLGIIVTRAPGPMTAAPDETGERETIAFIEDPDGYRIELIAKA